MEQNRWTYAIFTGGAIHPQLWELFINAWDGDVDKLPDGILEIQYLDNYGLVKTFKRENLPNFDYL